MFNILSQITLKVKFLRNEEQHCLLPSLVDDFTCVHSKNALLTSCQLYFLVPLSSFLAHLLALSHCISEPPLVPQHAMSFFCFFFAKHIVVGHLFTYHASKNPNFVSSVRALSLQIQNGNCSKSITM